MKNLKLFMKWYNTEFCRYFANEYMGSYEGNKKILISKLSNGDFISKSIIYEIVDKVRELELTMWFQVDDNGKPQIEVCL